MKKYTCCSRIFDNKKSLSNHTRWCSGLCEYRKDAGYHAIHAWVRKRKIKPSLCEDCQENKARDLANISGNYLRDTDDYVYLCRSCHKKLDLTEQTRKIHSKNAIARQRDERGCFL